MSSPVRPAEGRPSSRTIAPVHVVDLFVYVVVLNLAAQFVPVVITETFSMSLLAAFVLKVVLEVVLLVKDRVKARFKSATRPLIRVAFALLLWVVLAGSKFLVLELIALVFHGRVSLGGFWSVTGLVVVLMLCRVGVRRLLAPPAGG
ncbi:hypothetical protein [Raineyella sp. W15-4]|uniref:hypothetical protein n=1 Tax=Raineyella sp. W15-4 TaxID=3081651 RepID=UPI002952ED9B|nr:hypothetical protein [Raineyella sp. W15-4]WOQ18268.1 hypothetical protein R0145_06130 [Raineyella sp. W15-4]